MLNKCYCTANSNIAKYISFIDNLPFFYFHKTERFSYRIYFLTVFVIFVTEQMERLFSLPRSPVHCRLWWQAVVIPARKYKSAISSKQMVINIVSTYSDLL